MARIAIIDYGMGNLRSVQKAFEHIGVDAEITDDADELLNADGIVLPGVGAFADCIKNLTDTGLIPSIKEFTASGRPFLGICLGLQLLFDSSMEGGLYTGLGLLAGQVVPLPKDKKVPHMGWNNLNIKKPEPLLKGLPREAYVYFVHSYHAVPLDGSILAATTSYGTEVTAVVQSGNIFATQFHPEKSGDIGLQILSNFGGLL